VRSQDNQMVHQRGCASRLADRTSLVTLYNLYPSATILGAPARGVSSGQALAVMQDIAKRTLPSDVGYQCTAMSYQEKLTGQPALVPVSVSLVYFCLSGQYESWLLPLAVLSAVPLAVLGPVVVLTSLGVANNLYTQIGLILTIALSARNGILIVEMAREGRIVHGKPILEAAVEASRLRFCPILMTSFAFGLAVVPLVLATGAGANSEKSLGLSVLKRHHRLDLPRGAVRPSFFAVFARLGGTAEGAQESTRSDLSNRKVSSDSW
jgi:HAE1 family hydrophobic/amphiphilic exporter-1